MKKIQLLSELFRARAILAIISCLFYNASLPQLLYSNQSILTRKIQDIAIVIMPRHYITRLPRGDIASPDTGVQVMYQSLGFDLEFVLQIQRSFLKILIFFNTKDKILCWQRKFSLV